MFTIAGAPLDEVWGGQKPKMSKPSKRRSNGPNKMYDDIIDAYIDDFQPSGHKQEHDEIVKPTSRVSSEFPDDYFNTSYINERKVVRNPSKKCVGEVLPSISEYNEEPLEYDRFFNGGNMFPAQKESHPHHQSMYDATPEQEEQIGDAYVPDEEAYQTNQNNHVLSEYHQQQPYYTNQYQPQSFQPHEASQSSQYIEMFMYIMSGILLIIILEQILHLGLYLR